MLVIIKTLFKLIYSQIVTTDYSPRSMAIGYLLSIFSFNYVEQLVKYIRKNIAWGKEALIDNHYELYIYNKCHKISFTCKIYYEISKNNDIIDATNEIITSEQALQYENEINEFLLYYMKFYERFNKNQFSFGLSEVIHNKNIRYKIKDIQPSVKNIRGSLCGILTVITYTKLNKDDIELLSNDISNNLFDCFGESIEQRLIKIGEKSLILSFRDDDFKCKVSLLDD